MHSVIYRTKMLRECGLKLPEHCFYVDNIYVYYPLPYVKSMYYIDENLYRYFIGRDDQSVNEKVMISRIDQQIRVNNLMFDYFSQKCSVEKNGKPLYNYMYNYLEIITTITSILLILRGDKAALKIKEDFWNSFKDRDEALYKRLRHGLLGVSMNLPGKVGRGISKTGYRICQKIFKFN